MTYDMSNNDTRIETNLVASDHQETNLFELGLSYATGVGAEINYIEAHKWFNIAALRGDCEAKLRRQELTEMMTQSQVSAAQRAAREWLLRATH